MKATVNFHLSTDGHFEIDINKNKLKNYTIDEFLQYLYDNFIEDGKYDTDEAILDFGQIEFEDGDVIYF